MESNRPAFSSKMHGIRQTPSWRRIWFRQQAVDSGDRCGKSGDTLGQSGLGHLASRGEISHPDEALDQPCPGDDACAVDRQRPPERLDGLATATPFALQLPQVFQHDRIVRV